MSRCFVLRINLCGAKRCTACQIVKNAAYFSWRPADPRRRRRTRFESCKKCRAAYSMRYYNSGNNRTKQMQNMRLWNSANGPKVAESKAEWRQANPDKTKAQSELRTARLRAAPGGAFVASRYSGRVQFFAGLCAYCRERPYHGLDHAIPITRGGGNWPANIYPACKSCNSSKHNKKLYSEWWPKAKH